METNASSPGLRLSEFEEYRTRVGKASSNAAGEQLAAKATATHKLLGSSSPEHLAELGWRLGLALAPLNFVLLGLAVASVNPRAGRSASLVLALFSFIVYYNLMTLGQSWIAVGRSNLWTFLLQLHGGALVCATVTLAVRHNRWSLRQLWARASRPSTTPEATV